ncbi:efflux RND transporter periplasmic adaptor subunit [Lentisphaerota bacterium WC36G]|nr:efflux RND transporter periplasmic adaptor subunit [Lentisphaerae bacterium WC36]
MNSNVVNVDFNDNKDPHSHLVQNTIQEVHNAFRIFESKHYSDQEAALQHHFKDESSVQKNNADTPNKLDKFSTGMLRFDLKLIPGGIDINAFESFVLFDPVTDNYFRLTKENKRIIELITEDMKLSKFIAKLRRHGITAPDEKVISLIGFLHQSNLTMPTANTTHQRVLKMHEQMNNNRLKMLLSSYLFFKIPLIKPDNFLNKTAALIKAIFNKWSIFLLVFLAVIGYICVVFNFHKLSDIFIKSISIKGLIRYSIAIVIIKIVHEFAHAYMTKLSGCRVRRMGIAVVFFMPRLYSDLTDAWRVSSRHKRFLIDGAGIISELIIGGLAALVWANTMSGNTNTVAYYIFAVSIINTVFVNGNPLIRYDGYYMLMDFLNVDNLQKRSIEMMKYIRHRYWFGIAGKVPDGFYTNARVYLVLYGIGAYIYRIFLYTSIIMVVYFQFTKAIGIILLILEVYVLIIMPLQMEIKQLIMLRKKMTAKNVLITSSLTAILLAIFIIPLPWSIEMPCITQSDNASFVYTQTDGYLQKIYVKDGDIVQKGDAIVKLDDPNLNWLLADQVQEKKIAQTKLDALNTDIETLSAVNTQKLILNQVNESISQTHHLQKMLTNKAQSSGTFALFDRKLKQGKWLEKGTFIGEVFSKDEIVLHAFIVESDYSKVKINDQVNFTISDNLKVYKGKVASIFPVPTELRPSPLLQPFGGPILCNKVSDVTYKPLTQYYELKIIPDSDIKNELLNGRTGTVSIKKYSSLAWNMITNARNIINKELSF